MNISVHVSISHIACAAMTKRKIYFFEDVLPHYGNPRVLRFAWYFARRWRTRKDVVSFRTINSNTLHHHFLKFISLHSHNNTFSIYKVRSLKAVEVALLWAIWHCNLIRTRNWCDKKCAFTISASTITLFGQVMWSVAD